MLRDPRRPEVFKVGLYRDGGCMCVGIEFQMTRACSLLHTGVFSLGNPHSFVTVADGLRSTLKDKTWPIVRDLVEKIFVVSEAEIIAGMRLVWETMKLVRCIALAVLPGE